MGPTSKQLAFADAIVSGANPSEAYRAAYSCGRMSASSVAREAQRLMSNPKIAPIIDKGRRAAARRAAWSRETAIERLEAVNAVSYSRMMETGPQNGFQRADSMAFFGSLDRLRAMTEGCDAGGGAPVVVDGGGNVIGRAGVVLYFDREEQQRTENNR